MAQAAEKLPMILWAATVTATAYLMPLFRKEFWGKMAGSKNVTSTSVGGLCNQRACSPWFAHFGDLNNDGRIERSACFSNLGAPGEVALQTFFCILKNHWISHSMPSTKKQFADGIYRRGENSKLTFGLPDKVQYNHVPTAVGISKRIG